MAGVNDAAARVVGKFTKQDVIALVTILGAILALGVYVGRTMGSYEQRLASQEKSLQDFMDDGGRCPDTTCVAFDVRISTLEAGAEKLTKKVDELPPLWFKRQVDDLMAATKALREQVSELTVHVRDLRQAPSRHHHSPNDQMAPGIVPGK